MICIGGVCIPYAAMIPMLINFFRYLRTLFWTRVGR
ncbi:Conserved small cysteine-containing protein of unknown function [Ostreococcus lucimarinus CCE9901]|uniref:Uncharacterized protein n=1 Tax=Ostreococcus lucimarinus (strain CCE9901) TaxID=436017 RepID=A4RT09_OSTLU|nr:Conserved small cysteine-containing protein of unknown function [Ostreococcus lucimarinus CCE9901]ABO94445.1 Conserved small cysteine-containing protein of unknown function [Ostreococcus lucimarinus CCE9901]|eukprot:XP_001416152.1 Conserved small cysteine-containing protein of unknown function [Ostreococcus lucimarinus CCE9901]